MSGGARLQNGVSDGTQPDGWKYSNGMKPRQRSPLGEKSFISIIHFVFRHFCWREGYSSYLQRRRMTMFAYMKPVRKDTYSMFDIRPWSTTTAVCRRPIRFGVCPQSGDIPLCMCVLPLPPPSPSLMSAIEQILSHYRFCKHTFLFLWINYKTI